MINGAPINALPINGLAAADQPTPTDPTAPTIPITPPPSPVEPASTEPVEFPSASGWRLRVLINGVDLTERLTGSVKVTAEESAARLAELSLIPLETEVEPLTWMGRDVQISSIHVEDETETEIKRFGGKVSSPAWDTNAMVLSLTCSDRYKETLEAMETSQIDSLVGGSYMVEIGGDIESHYDYARQRLETVPAGLDMSVNGDLRLTAWQATSTPHFLFDADAVIDDTLGVDLMSVDDLYNRVIVTASYRFSRLRQRAHTFRWSHPDGDFCTWRINASDLPTVSMVTEALTGAGWHILGELQRRELPPSGSLPDLCPGAQGGWINNFTADPFLLGAEATVIRRIAQTITQTYTVTVQCPDSIAAYGEQIMRQSYSAETEYDASEWEAMDPDKVNPDYPALDDDSFGTVDAVGDRVLDKSDDTLRQNLLYTAYCLASTAIKSSHRATRINFESPIPPVDLDVIHTARVEASGCIAQGKVFSLAFSWDIESGRDTVAISLAVSAGYGSGDEDFSVPPSPDVKDLPGTGETDTVLATQLAQLGDTEANYQEDLDGYSGNAGMFGNGAYSIFPRRFQITTPDIAAAYTDEQTPSADVPYNVSTPDDALTLENEP